ncbi:hypothetical protein BUALT_Bualt12G0120800 [Buddleja alternifolia]|uniref:C2 domain-containing protein n=1 Tax=Buddleja alternifolia TaxID=168488 RepID=A0AAV6WS87_9LAMI|nr:hypothetical protein BUALT_Bualt12G0120800 [Buddleja alternifolia]
MKNRTLEITLQYATDLNNVNLITKMDVYAVVSISGGDDNSKQKTKSPVDHDGDCNPTWNFPMRFAVEEAALQQNRLTLDFKLICERALGDKDIGEVNVPITDLLESPANGAAADWKRFVSYQVRKPSGKPKGQITFSYKFGEKPASDAAEVCGESIVTYPVVDTSSVYPPTTLGGYPPPPYPVVASAEGGGHYPPPPGVYPPPPPPAGYGYPPAPPPEYWYPPQPPPPEYGYPPQPPPGYGYPPPSVPPGYGYPPQAGYVYPPAVQLVGWWG